MIMKKVVITLLSLGMLANFSLIGHCAITQEAKDSLYLPNNSWVLNKLEEKLTGTAYHPVENWKDKVSIGYACVDSGAPNPETIPSVLKTSGTIGVAIPLDAAQEELGMDLLFAGIEFEKSFEIEDIVEVLNDTEQPTAGGDCKVSIYNSGSGGDTYDAEITAMGKEQANIGAEDFTFDNQTKIYLAHMGDYTYGYILKDQNDKKLFWCCKAVNEFEKGKFYKLADVLNAYKDDKERTTGINSPYVRWV